MMSPNRNARLADETALNRGVASAVVNPHGYAVGGPARARVDERGGDRDLPRSGKPPRWSIAATCVRAVAQGGMGGPIGDFTDAAEVARLLGAAHPVRPTVIMRSAFVITLAAVAEAVAGPWCLGWPSLCKGSDDARRDGVSVRAVTQGGLRSKYVFPLKTAAAPRSHDERLFNAP